MVILIDLAEWVIGFCVFWFFFIGFVVMFFVLGFLVEFLGSGIFAVCKSAFVSFNVV